MRARLLKRACATPPPMPSALLGGGRGRARGAAEGGHSGGGRARRVCSAWPRRPACQLGRVRAAAAVARQAPEDLGGKRSSAPRLASSLHTAQPRPAHLMPPPPPKTKEGCATRTTPTRAMGMLTSVPREGLSLRTSGLRAGGCRGGVSEGRLAGRCSVPACCCEGRTSKRLARHGCLQPVPSQRAGACRVTASHAHLSTATNRGLRKLSTLASASGSSATARYSELTARVRRVGGRAGGRAGGHGGKRQVG